MIKSKNPALANHDEEDLMTALHADYAYRHSTKPKRQKIHPQDSGHQRARPGLPNNPSLMDTGQKDEEERRHTLLHLAKAERGLHLLDHSTFKRDTTANNVALRVNELGVKNVRQGNLVRAFRNFLEAINRDPALDLAHNNIGLLYLEIGDHERADLNLSKAIAQEGNLDVAYSNRALLSIELGEYAKAYEDLEKALGIDPDEPMHYNNMGVLFLECGDPQTALQCFQAAADLDRANPMHYNNIGMAYQETGDWTTANQAFQRAMELSDRELEASMAEPGV